MKKLAIGCGVGVLILAVLGGVAAYYFVYRPARALVAQGTEFVSSMSQLGEIGQLDATVVNTRPFAGATDGVLTEAQVTRFVAVQESIHTTLGAKASELERKYKAVSGEGQTPSLAEVMGAYKDIFALIVEAKRAQVTALNAQGFSLDEYGWVKTRFYEAAGVQLTGIDLRELAEKVGNGELEALKGLTPTAAAGTDGATAADAPIADTPGAGIPDANKALVAQYKDRTPAWLAYAMFGL